MNDLLVLTFADKPLSDENHLKKSCDQFNLQLRVLIFSPWTQNVIRLKLLYEFMAEQDPELVMLVTDAYDVVLYDNSETILDIFLSLKSDIVFSGESNFSFRDPHKWVSYLRRYPRGRATIYHYLNAGTFMGRAKHLLQLLGELQEVCEIDLFDERALLPIKSDQYLLSRFFVDNSRQSGKLKLSIDEHHALMGCTGGRFCVLKFPDLGKWQAFSFFMIERSLLKLLNLHKHQKVPKDFTFRLGRFYNKKTKTYPPVIHFPGTQNRFNNILEDLSKATPAFSKKGGWIFAAGISCFAFLVSLFIGPIFWLITRKLP
ncbi:MAG: hypothetical protein OXH57_00695 [Ekhidna sp.]|nr:hypothetical protein [Ekhidna sp.]